MLNITKLILGLAGAPIAAGAGWLCAAVAKYGVHLDKTGITALATAGVAGAIALVGKLIHDVETHHPQLARDLGEPEPPHPPPGTPAPSGWPAEPPAVR